MKNIPQMKVLPSIAEKHAALAEKYLLLLLETRRKEASDLILQAVEDGVSIKDIHFAGFSTCPV